MSRSGAFRDLPITVPCGGCIGCRLERSRQWAIRMTHEAQMQKKNCFLTLTYDDQHLPIDGSVNVQHWQLFAKRYRNYLAKTSQPISAKKFRFFHCGEYGESNNRPHYHAAIFGQDFTHDQVEANKTEKGDQLYTSATLDSIWKMGKCWIGELNYQSAAYIARYIMKKVTGPDAETHYQNINYQTGEVFQVLPEYVTMSRKPGIGYSWIEKYMSDVYPSDELVIAGKASQPPKFYDRQYEKKNPEGFKTLLGQRARRGLEYEADNTPDRREVKETVKLAAISEIKRDKNVH